MKSKYLILSLCLSAFIMACGGEDEPTPTPVTCDTEDITYTNYAKDILDASCATSGCHNNTSFASGFSLEDYDNTVLALAFNRTIGSINHDSGFSPMPKGASKLDDCTIEKLTVWIDNGAPE